MAWAGFSFPYDAEMIRTLQTSLYYNGEGTDKDKGKAKTFFQNAVAQSEDEGVQERAADCLRKIF